MSSITIEDSVGEVLYGLPCSVIKESGNFQGKYSLAINFHDGEWFLRYEYEGEIFGSVPSYPETFTGKTMIDVIGQAHDFFQVNGKKYKLVYNVSSTPVHLDLNEQPVCPTCGAVLLLHARDEKNILTVSENFLALDEEGLSMQYHHDVHYQCPCCTSPFYVTLYTRDPILDRYRILKGETINDVWKI